MKITGKITVDMKPVNQILKAKGLTADGDVQYEDRSLPAWSGEHVTLYAQWEAIP